MINNNDIYLPHWIQQLMPIYNPDYLYEKFMKADHGWRIATYSIYNDKLKIKIKLIYVKEGNTIEIYHQLNFLKRKKLPNIFSFKFSGISSSCNILPYSIL